MRQGQELTSNQFYVARIDGAASRVVLEGDEHRHLSRSARVGRGEEVWLFDSAGARCRARVESVGRERTTLFVLERRAPEASRLRLILVQALVPAMPFLPSLVAEITIFAPREATPAALCRHARSW